MDHKVEKLFVILANTYALYLKTQNYHWHIYGPHFKLYHELLDEQYHELIDPIDTIAERIVMLGDYAPASFEALNALKTLADADPHIKPIDMLKDLHDDHKTLIEGLYNALLEAQEANDEATADLLTGRIASHEKMRWILGAHFKGTK